ncbi:type I-E CRISPR-associated protein Cas7/Cse4/CasC [Propioniciclava sinopodophylli]|uniref:type I-E CRISPR-associated protein Cas7/Cse4/CasC n=1 Tax=Propioniciclava sinopodophylli TaxID=1837344 RepID=UPI00248F96AB|nr:type I-E CRISPR-associated protein Cas7/Cse4/CasC [Propioniciclava sinopodophylli]
MTTYIEIHALQNMPPSNVNRDDSGAPKSARYGGVQRSRVSSQSWKKAMRDDFNQRLDPKDVGTRSRMLVSQIAEAITAERQDLAERAESLAVNAMEAAGFKKPVPQTRGKAKEGAPETGYLVFMSQRQIDALAHAAVTASAGPDPLADMKAAKVKDLVDADHSIDIALFGRMVADSTDLNVDAACQVAHALSVHEAIPEYDFYTAVDDVKARNDEADDSGAGMMGTVGFVSSTLYRYAALNVDQLRINLGNGEAVRIAIDAFLHSFIQSMPTGKQNTFANSTRPTAVLVTVATGQPTSLVGAFERPVDPQDGFMRPAVAALAAHAREVFEAWRKPELSLVQGLSSAIEPLTEVAEVVDVNELVNRSAAKALGMP